MHIRILDRYIFREVSITFLFGVCAFSAVFIGSGTLYRLASYITEYGAPLPAVLKIFFYSLPAIVIYTFPMSMLLTALLTFGRLSANSEITAMKSCGISFIRISMPAIFLGLLVSICAIYFNEYVVPWANNAYQDVLYYEIRGNANLQSTEHIILKQIEGGQIKRLLYARRYDADTETLQGVTLQAFSDDGNIGYVENASYANWQGNQWTMHQGTVYEINDGGAERSMRFDSQVLPIDTSPREIVRAQKKPEELTMKELRQEINIMRTQYVDTRKLETELYQRITIPMASLVFVLVGVPLGIQPNRGSSSRGFALSFAIIFVYYALMTMSGALAQSGALAPAYAVWIPNVVGALAGIYLMRKAAR